VELDKLDYHHYLPIFFDGIREKQVGGNGGERRLAGVWMQQVMHDSAMSWDAKSTSVDACS